jgi:co-chaperonin GroES (HSP10)
MVEKRTGTRIDLMFKSFAIFRTAQCGALLLSVLFATGFRSSAIAQTPAAARQLGTVKAISGNTLTLAPDNGLPLTVTLTDTARIVQLAPGSTDLKAATPIAIADIAVGDRVLVTGKAGDAADQFTASRVILMKSGDIAQKHAAEQADWQKRGSGGVVTAVDAATGTLTVAAGAKKVAVKASGTTIFRRYSGDSIKFENAVPGTLAQVQAGDQLRVRGAKSEDGTSIQAEEIVSGSFTNLAGVLATVDAPNGTLTLKDLSTKKMMTVKVTANSDLRALPERAAMMFAARAKGIAPAGAGASASASAASAGSNRGAGAPIASGAPAGNGGQRGPGGEGGSGGPGAPGGPGASGGAARSAGMDLSQMISRLPNQTINDLKAGEAVMIVASRTGASSTNVTAITLLTGVEPILAASPGGEAMTLSPWSVGGAPEGGGPQ